MREEALHTGEPAMLILSSDCLPHFPAAQFFTLFGIVEGNILVSLHIEIIELGGQTGTKCV